MKKKEPLSQLQKTIQSRNKLRNMFKEKKLLDLGLYEEATKLQKPTIEAIEEIKKPVINTVISTTNNPEIEMKYLPLDKEQSFTNKYILQRTTEKINLHGNEYRVWLLGQHFFLLVIKDNQEYILDYSLRDSLPIKLTEGLNEILFNNGNNKDIITNDDIKTWENLLKNSNIIGYKNSTYWKQINSKPSSSSPIIEEVPDTPKKGEGIETIIIPSNPIELYNEFSKQLASCKAGNNNTFNKTNALMKEMLKQKIINGKDYRNVLREFYHI